MTSLKEDQQPMTTREELVALADRVDHHVGFFACQRMPISLAEWDRISNDLLDAAKFVRLASRQEASVEELARVIDPIAFGIKPSMYGLRSQQELEMHVFVSGARGVARDKARALLAEYSITKRSGT